MARFKLDHLKPAGTIEHVMTGVPPLAPDVDPNPIALQLQHAGKGNDKYRREMKNADARGADSHERAGIFARTVVTGWKHVYDAEGKPVAFSPEEAGDLFGQLIDLGYESDVLEALLKAHETKRFAGHADVGKE